MTMNAQLKPTPNEIPPGYRRNALGHLVPEDRIKPQDLDRDALVAELYAMAEAMQEKMRQFKIRAFNDINAHVELVAEKYGAKVGGEKGFITLTSFDGQTQVKIQMGARMTFGEELAAARELVHGCIHRWTEDLRQKDMVMKKDAEALGHIKALVEHAFRTDEEGRLSPSKIWELTRVEITGDDEWSAAMEAIRDSVRWEGKKPYLRFNKRRGDGKWDPLPLDIAVL
jgi:hypothetical protein